MKLNTFTLLLASIVTFGNLSSPLRGMKRSPSCPSLTPPKFIVPVVPAGQPLPTGLDKLLIIARQKNATPPQTGQAAAQSILDLATLHITRKLTPTPATNTGFSFSGMVTNGLHMAVQMVMVQAAIKTLDFVFNLVTYDKKENARHNLFIAQKALADAEDRAYACEGRIQTLKLQLIGAPATKKEAITRDIAELETELTTNLQAEVAKKQAYKNKISALFLELASK